MNTCSTDSIILCTTKNRHFHLSTWVRVCNWIHARDMVTIEMIGLGDSIKTLTFVHSCSMSEIRPRASQLAHTPDTCLCVCQMFIFSNNQDLAICAHYMPSFFIIMPRKLNCGKKNQNLYNSKYFFSFFPVQSKPEYAVHTRNTLTSNQALKFWQNVDVNVYMYTLQKIDVRIHFQSFPSSY